MKKHWSCLFIGITAFHTLSASPLRETLVGGKPDSSNHFKSVFIWTSEGFQLQKNYCTATKISTRLILTAAHCVLEQQQKSPDLYLGPWVWPSYMGAGHKMTYSFKRALESTDVYETLTIRNVFIHPVDTYCLEHRDLHLARCEYRAPYIDVAVIEVEPSGTFSSAPVNEIDTAWVRGDRPVIMTGYGMESDEALNLPRLKYGPSVTRTNEVILKALHGTEAETHGFPNLNIYFGTTSDDDFQVNLGSGDSGGPILDARSEKVIGVNSDGFCPLSRPNCQVTNNSTFARISDTSEASVGTWLRGLIGQAPY